MKLIGICGKAGSGKNTVGDLLSEHFGVPTYAFADPLKYFINYLFNWDDSHANGELKEVISNYRLTQWRSNLIGMCHEVFEDLVSDIDSLELTNRFYKYVLIPHMISENYDNQTTLLRCSPRQIYQVFGTEFARSIKQNMWIELARQQLQYTGEGLIVTDLRFRNEAEWIKEEGGKVLKITRPNLESVNTHISEQGDFDELIDVTLNNSESLSSLPEIVNLAAMTL